jgi:membrane fusion protein (multidrug efflux system)
MIMAGQRDQRAQIAPSSLKDAEGLAASVSGGDSQTATVPLAAQPHPKPADLPAPTQPASGKSGKGSPRRFVALVLVPLILAAGVFFGYRYWTVGRFQISTDDAYIGADIATLSAKVSGYVTSVEVGDHAHVRTGDVIARIDDGDYKLAVQTATDKIATQKASIARMDSQIVAQQAAIEQARAQLTANEADAKRASLELDRQKDLAQRDFSSRQTLETTEARNTQAVAAVRSAKAAIDAALANVEVTKAQKGEAEGTLKQLETALAIAQRDLSFTVIRAPFDGVIGNRAMQKGDLVQPGQRLASLVPLDAVYIDANFKETQLEGMRAGQAVDIEVDAVPGHVFHGKVVSFAPASGAVFSLLPPENATGNFTKVVQRVPVRIRVEQRADEHDLLRPGMSVVVSVNTKADATGPMTAQAGGH